MSPNRPLYPDIPTGYPCFPPVMFGRRNRISFCFLAGRLGRRSQRAKSNQSVRLCYSMCSNGYGALLSHRPTKLFKKRLNITRFSVFSIKKLSTTWHATALRHSIWIRESSSKTTCGGKVAFIGRWPQTNSTSTFFESSLFESASSIENPRANFLKVGEVVWSKSVWNSPLAVPL